MTTADGNDWTQRNPLFQTFSDHELARLVRDGSAKDKRAAKAEIAYRAARARGEGQ